jgi:hypothetical protein
MTLQRPHSQSFDSLSDDFIVGYFQSLGFQLQESPIEIGGHFFLPLSTRQEISFRIELRLEPLEVQQKLLFELLSRIDAS